MRMIILAVLVISLFFFCFFTCWWVDCGCVETLDPRGSVGQEGFLGVGSSCTCPSLLERPAIDPTIQKALMS